MAARDYLQLPWAGTESFSAITIMIVLIVYLLHQYMDCGGGLKLLHVHTAQSL